MTIKISDLLPKNNTVEITGGNLEIHGLTVEQIGQLVTQYKERFLIIFTGLDAGTDYTTLLTEAPELIVTVIALGANATGQEDDIGKMIALDQLTVFSAIMKQTFPDQKKLQTLLNDISRLLTQLNATPAQTAKKQVQKKTH